MRDPISLGKEIGSISLGKGTIAAFFNGTKRLYRCYQEKVWFVHAEFYLRNMGVPNRSICCVFWLAGVLLQVAAGMAVVG